jgi:hypothetical protein
MICAFSHNPAKPRRGDVYAKVQAFCPVSACCVPPASLRQKPPVCFGYALPVHLIGRIVHIAEISQAIVQAVAVDVINKICLFAVGKEPANTVSHVSDIVVSEPVIAVSSFISNRSVRNIFFPLYRPYQITS